VFYGDVCVGTIARRAGVPTHVDQRGVALRIFYPGMEPGQDRNGIARDVDHARRFRSGMAEAPADAAGSQLPEMARPARSDGAELCDVGARRGLPLQRRVR
jgi:hypothetical protein